MPGSHHQRQSWPWMPATLRPRARSFFITADHGNADEMKDEAGNPVTKHSLNPVPFLGLGRYMEGKRLEDGRLADVTPTILEIGGLKRWPEVTGHSLLAPKD